jgi:hypothetical protein
MDLMTQVSLNNTNCTFTKLKIQSRCLVAQVYCPNVAYNELIEVKMRFDDNYVVSN